MKQIKGYYLYVTNNCNLSCKYCDGVNIERNLRKIQNNKIGAKKLVSFIINDKVSQDEEKVLIFFGGEPLLAQSYIEKVIEEYRRSSSNGNKLKFMIQTNGTLLDKMSRFVAENLDHIFVSLDGEKINNDEFRGQGTFSRIMKNFFNFKEKTKAITTARITLSQSGSVLGSTLGLIQYFDNVFWQIENSPYIFSNMDSFKKRYRKEIKTLLDYWMENLRNGNMVNIIPLQAVVESFLTGKENRTFRCGSSGSGQVYIDLEGNCYVCDKLMNKKEFMVGNIYDGVSSEDKFLHTELNSECKRCRIKFICGGRCLPQVLLYPKEKFRFYCENTKILVKEVEKRLPEIRHLINKGVIDESKFDNSVIELTEQIP